MCYRETLRELQRKINKIEDEDENYRENPNWKRYRSQQEGIWKIIKKNNDMEIYDD